MTIVSLGDHEFDLLRGLIRAHAGITLNDHKRSLMHARLSRRLHQLGLRSFRDYYTYLTQEAHAEERTRFVNALTTNTTAFFRERHHFEYLAHTWVPALRRRTPREQRRILRVWSSACATGEEAYSLAITLSEALQPLPAWEAQIFASDIDTDALLTARTGIYSQRSVEPVPKVLRRRYFHAGSALPAGCVQAIPQLRGVIRFSRLNLVDEPWPALPRFDVILCRNVTIYFDAAAKHRLMARFHRALQPGGLLILGHSESLLGRDARFRSLGQTIYQLEAA
jgi:chemotaxis protein methyltransferase CheR